MFSKKTLPVYILVITLLFGFVIPLKLSAQIIKEKKGHKIPLVAEITFPNGSTKIVLIEGIYPYYYEGWGVYGYDQNDIKTYLWLDEINTITNATEKSALFTLNNGSKRSLTFPYAYIIHAKSNDGVEIEIPFSKIKSVKFITSPMSNYGFKEEVGISAIAKLRSGNSVVCSGITFREMNLEDFQFWTQPNLGDRDDWTATRLGNIHSIIFGDFGRDYNNNQYIEITISYFDGKIQKAYTSSNYSFYYHDYNLPEPLTHIQLSEISSIQFSSQELGSLCSKCNRRFFNDEWKYCPYCGNLLRKGK